MRPKTDLRACGLARLFLILTQRRATGWVKPKANVLFVRNENPCDAKIDVRFKRALTHPPVRSTLLPRGYARNRPLRADIAQLVEQRIRNAKVVGSTPIIGTTLNDKSLASTPRNKHQKSFIPVSGQTCLNEHTSACSPPFPNNPKNISQMNNTNWQFSHYEYPANIPHPLI